MTEFIHNGSIVTIVLVFLVGASFLGFTAYEQKQIKAQGEPNILSLNSNNTNVDENDTVVLSNDSISEEQMEIQICDETHPC